jgi:hypothetical protein
VGNPAERSANTLRERRLNPRGDSPLHSEQEKKSERMTSGREKRSVPGRAARGIAERETGLLSKTLKKQISGIENRQEQLRPTGEKTRRATTTTETNERTSATNTAVVTEDESFRTGAQI